MFFSFQDCGYQHGRALLSGWIKGGLVDELFKPKNAKKKVFKDEPVLKRVEVSILT